MLSEDSRLSNIASWFTHQAHDTLSTPVKGHWILKAHQFVQEKMRHVEKAKEETDAPPLEWIRKHVGSSVSHHRKNGQSAQIPRLPLHVPEACASMDVTSTVLVCFHDLDRNEPLTLMRG